MKCFKTNKKELTYHPSIQECFQTIKTHHPLSLFLERRSGLPKGRLSDSANHMPFKIGKPMFVGSPKHISDILLLFSSYSAMSVLGLW